jgi:hypothetical protein
MEPSAIIHQFIKERDMALDELCEIKKNLLYLWQHQQDYLSGQIMSFKEWYDSIEKARKHADQTFSRSKEGTVSKVPIAW